MPNLITVDKDKLSNLLETLLYRDAVLYALESGGVDNWDWYSRSLEDENYELEESTVQDRVKSTISDLLCVDKDAIMETLTSFLPY